jgi:mevalonate kinase
MKFYSRGKLLISGEYLVMKGAAALTVPLLKGQSLQVDEMNEPGFVRWISNENGKAWFSCYLDISLFEVLTSSNDQKAQFLLNLLKSAHELNHRFPDMKRGYAVTTDLEFNLNWGYGSSSSLISNVAYWAEVDPFELHRKVSDGSGYDVVCARSDQPLIFKLKEMYYEAKPVEFEPSFHDQIYFIYLGQKQDSSASVRRFLSSKKADQGLISSISALSENMIKTHSLLEFNGYLLEHDSLMSQLLDLPRLKTTQFPDLEGEVKPLGAWGGDFAMLTWSGSRSELVDYLLPKNISVFFSFNEIVKTK